VASVELISVGIDIGTTTTLIMLSRLTVAETASLGSMPQARYGPARKPRAEIYSKEILYESAVHFTPISVDGLVDVEALERILRDDYAEAGISPDQVDTGAVIITGESAKKHNAERVLNTVAPLAGDFVSTVAGPALEAHLAGRGSGAAEWTSEHFARGTNVDIGGGTTNIAVFRQGELLGTVVLSVGGRHVQVDRATGVVLHVTRSGEKILRHLGLSLKPGDVATIPVLRAVARAMADLIADSLEGKVTPLALELMETPPLAFIACDDAVFISGGVADFFYSDEPVDSIRDMAIYGDMGPLLGEELRNHPRVRLWNVLKPPHTERATVMGASRETVTLSGMTIWVGRGGMLPIRNVPVVNPLVAVGFESADVKAAIVDGYRRWNLDAGRQMVALAFDLGVIGHFDDLDRLSHGVIEFASAAIPATVPVILASERDLGKAFGQLVEAGLPSHAVLSIDEVSLSEGDYVDIGQSLLGDRLVSLSIKTLIFSGE